MIFLFSFSVFFTILTNVRFQFFRFFKLADFLILILFIGVTVASFLFLRTHESQEANLIIKSSEKEFVYPLSKNREIEVKGLIGNSVIVIEDGKAYFKSSPCKNQVCIQMGAVHDENDWAACLPNDIFIRVE